MTMPPDSQARQLAGRITAQLETKLTELGIDASDLYAMSREEQTGLIHQVTDNVLSDPSVGELARLMENHNQTSSPRISSEQVDSTLENSFTKDTIELDRTKHAEDRSKERAIEDYEIQDAISNPLFVEETIVDDLGRKSARYIGNSATVVINPDTGRVITVWKTGARMRKKYGGSH